jgi:hypothetical protein
MADRFEASSDQWADFVERHPRPDPGGQHPVRVGAYLSVRFLLRYFRTRTLYPFAVYCLVAGVGSIVYLEFIK